MKINAHFRQWQFNWPALPNFNDLAEISRLYTAILVIYCAAEDYVHDALAVEDKYASLTEHAAYFTPLSMIQLSLHFRPLFSPSLFVFVFP
jgi:hypothetical protein